MNSSQLTLRTLLLTAGAVLPVLSSRAPASEPLPTVQIAKAESLQTVTSVAVSPDGRFLYSAAFACNAITTFTRDIATGTISLADAFTGPDLDASVSLRLSRSGAHAVACSFRSNTITLLQRDAATGRLTQLDVAREGDGSNAGLGFVIDAQFSPDGRYIYTAASSGVGVYRVAEDKLHFVQLQSADGRLSGLRGVTLHQNGRVLYAAAAQSSAVGVLRVDPVSGRLDVVEVLVDGENGNNALGGAFRVACSPRGEHVYVSSGRFGGDQAVSVFQAQSDGSLRLIEEHVNGAGELHEFDGGNDLAVSADGTRVYALATVSDRIARFARDPKSGRLALLSVQPAGEEAKPGCPGLCLSPDGRFLYIADETSSSIVVLKAL